MTKHTVITVGDTVPPGLIATMLADDDLTVAAATPVVIAPEAPPIGSGRESAFLTRIPTARAEEVLGPDREALLDNMRSAPKKVAEKMFNVLSFVSGKGSLSVFTETAINALQPPGSITVKQLAELFQHKGYSEKTARSQAQQQMSLLPRCQLASRLGDTITLVDGPMLAAIRAAQAGTVAPVVAEKRPRKTKEAATATPEPEAAPTPEDHDTALVEDLLVADEAANAPAEDLLAAPSPALKKMSAEAAIEAYAAELFGIDTDQPAPAKRSRAKKN